MKSERAENITQMIIALFIFTITTLILKKHEKFN